MIRKFFACALSAFLLAFLPTGGSSAFGAVYSDPGRWLELPTYTSMEADVFYLYPTVCRASASGGSAILEARSLEMRNGARAIFEERAEALERMGDIYAPFYAQVAAEPRALSSAEGRKLLDGAPKRDVFEAFDYYVNTYNHDRPFVLVGECQGAELLLALLSEYMKENASLRGRMLAAYVADCSVTEEYFRANPHLRLVDGPEGWRVILPSDRTVAGLRRTVE